MKLSKNQINLKFVLNRLLKLPFINTLNLGECVELTGSFINSLGVKDLYQYYICDVDIENYQGELPGNFYDIEAIRDDASKFNIKESLGKFEMNPNNYEFQIKDKVIHVEFKTGKLNILFKGYILDEDGFPTIPDNEVFINGLYWFIAHHYAFEKYLMDELSETKYRKIEQEHLYYMGSARYEGMMPNKAKMQSIVDQQLTIVPNQNLYRDAFLNSSNINDYKLIN